METIGFALIVLAVILPFYTVPKFIRSTEQKELIDRLYGGLAALVLSIAVAFIGLGFLFHP